MRSIYVIAPGPDGPSKIGIAASLQNRLSDIQIGYWGDLYLCYFNSFYAPNMYGGSLGVGEGFASCEHAAQYIETRSHRRLTEMGFHVRGEWFDVSPVDASKVIEKVADEGGLKDLVDADFWRYVDLYGGRDPGSKTDRRTFKSFMRSIEFGADAVSQYRDRFKDDLAA